MYIYYIKPKVLYFYKIIIKVWRLWFKPFCRDVLFIYGIWLFLNRLWSFIYKFYCFFHKRDKNLYNFIPFQYYYLTGSTATTFLEYIQRNLPEGVAMKVTKVNISFSETYMYAVYWYIYQNVFSLSLQLPLFILLLTFLLKILWTVIFFFRLKLVFKLIKKVTLENFKTMELCVKWKTFDTLVNDV